MHENKYIQEITKKLKIINPHKVLLFGSYANGIPHEYSDIDLLVVTNDNFMPTTFKENMKLHLSVSSKIRDIAGEIPIDLLVYTLPMYKQFIELKSSFSREIEKKGVVLYETNNTSLA